jgi:hypothetical protein
MLGSTFYFALFDGRVGGGDYVYWRSLVAMVRTTE